MTYEGVLRYNSPLVGQKNLIHQRPYFDHFSSSVCPRFSGGQKIRRRNQSAEDRGQAALIITSTSPCEQSESRTGDKFILRTNTKLIPASATRRSEDHEAGRRVRIGNRNQSRRQQHNGKQWVTQTQTNAGHQTLLTEKGRREGTTYVNMRNPDQIDPGER